MGGHVAGSESPLDGGVRENHAVIAGGSFNDFLATFTLLNNWVAAATIKLTSIFFHEGTFSPFLYRYANHGYHILSLRFYKVNPSFYLKLL